MRLFCSPDPVTPADAERVLTVTLYGQPGADDQASAGDAVNTEIRRRGFEPEPRAWDLLSVALSVVVADFAELRERSPDGWTREFDLHIAVRDDEFWRTQAAPLEEALAFLTTDRWRLTFHHTDWAPTPPRRGRPPDNDSVVLLSGGLDSLIGAIDLSSSGHTPIAVSQTVRGDADKQLEFAARIGNGIDHIQFNHNARVPYDEESSQRARSLVFLTFGVLAATALTPYKTGGVIPLYVCENGFIAINPPLTGSRLGSLSTRTAHPEFLIRLQNVLTAADLRVQIANPYSSSTKGEMLVECADQTLLRAEAARSTSCGRFQRFNYRHCGRCVPCQVRRAAFFAWGVSDTTQYVYEHLGRDDENHASFDDVRSVAMAIAAVREEGLDAWLSGALDSSIIADKDALREMVRRGVAELEVLHRNLGVV